MAPPGRNTALVVYRQATRRGGASNVPSPGGVPVNGSAGGGRGRVALRVRGISSGLYGWTQRRALDGLAADVGAVLRDCAAAGLDAVELDPTPEVQPLLRAAGLKVSAVYVGAPLHLPWEEVGVEERVLPRARRLAETGGVDLLVNADPKGGWGKALPKTADEISQQGDNLSRIAALVAPLGLRVCFHNHADEHARAVADLRSVIECAAPEVGLCVDTGWAHTARCDPLDWIRRYGTRVYALHLRNQRGPVPTADLATGDLSMPALWEALASAGYDGWLGMELWHRKDTGATVSMVEAARGSIALLRGLLGGGGSPARGVGG